MPKIIAICNKKGGVGKTITSVNLAVALVKQSKKVLVVDLDAQSNSTGILKTDRTLIEKYITDLFEITRLGGEYPDISTFIYTSDDGVDFIGSNTLLGNTEIGLASEMYRETILKRILEPIGRFYDYIILDCQPSIGIITINALAAADEIIIPVQANDFFCLDGLTNLMKYIKITQTHINPSLHIAGILITKYSAHTNISKLVCRTVYENQSIPVFKTKITLSTKVAETAAVKESIFRYSPKSKVVLEYTDLAKEVMEL